MLNESLRNDVHAWDNPSGVEAVGWIDGMGSTMKLCLMLRSTLPLVVALTAGSAACAQEEPQYAYPQQVYDTDGQSVDSVAVFYEPLSRYGRWLDTRFGRAWSPNVGRDWRPYTIGHWEEGPYGKTWRSDEPFGWAVFHFGRWGSDPAVGWVWTPDTVWGPGWVAWRDGDDIAGWAPLPPRVSLSFSFGSSFGDTFNGLGYDQWYQPGWIYVPRPALYGRSLRGAILPYGRNRDYWAGTRGITRYDRADGRVFNRSFDRDDERRGERRDEVRRDEARRDDGRRDDARRDDGRRDDARRAGQQDELRRRNDLRDSNSVLIAPRVDPRGFPPARRDFGWPLESSSPGLREYRGTPRRVDEVPRFSGGARVVPPISVPSAGVRTAAPPGIIRTLPAPVPIEAVRPAPQRIEPSRSSQQQFVPQQRPPQPRERNPNVREP